MSESVLSPRVAPFTPSNLKRDSEGKTGASMRAGNPAATACAYWRSISVVILIKVITTVRVCGYSDFDEQKLQAFQKRLSKHGISTEHGAGEVS